MIEKNMKISKDSKHFYNLVFTAFQEGYDSYTTACNSMTSLMDEWKDSLSRKKVVDKIGEDATAELDSE